MEGKSVQQKGNRKSQKRSNVKGEKSQTPPKAAEKVQQTTPKPQKTPPQEQQKTKQNTQQKTPTKVEQTPPKEQKPKQVQTKVEQQKPKVGQTPPKEQKPKQVQTKVEQQKPKVEQTPPKEQNAQQKTPTKVEQKPKQAQTAQQKTPPKRKFAASGDSSLESQSFKRRKVEKTATGDALTEYEQVQMEEEAAKTPAEQQKEKEQRKKQAKLQKKKDDRKEKVQKLYGQWDNIQYADKGKIAQYFSTKVIEALSSTISAEELKTMPFGEHMWATVPANPGKEKHEQFDMAHLPTAVSTLVPAILKEKLTVPNASPLVFVVSSNTERVIAIAKEMYKLGRVATTKPLFARHKPLDAHVKEVNAGSFRICVTTPGRLLQLLDIGAMKSNQCKLVVIDMTPDAKGVCGLNQFEMRRDVSQIFWKHLKDKKNVKWALY